MAEVKLEPNSKRYKDEKEEGRPKTDALVTSQVIKPKKNGLNTVLGFFLVESPKEAVKRVIREEVRPGIGKLIFNALSAGLEHMFGYDSGRASYESVNRNGYRDYSGYNRTRHTDDLSSGRGKKKLVRSNMEEFRDWLFSKSDAEAILEALLNSADEYGDAPIAIIYEACGQVPDPVHYNYGWTSAALDNADIMHTTNGWRLQLPRVEKIDEE